MITTADVEIQGCKEVTEEIGIQTEEEKTRSNKRIAEFFKIISFVENEKVVLKYKEAAISKEPVKTKFCIYGQDKETTCTHQAYKGKINEEILKAMVQLWDIIDE